MTWCHVPETGFPFAPAPVALILASCLPSRDFTPAALSSGRTIPAKPSSQASAPDTSHPPRSGTTLPALTPDPLPGTSTPFWPDTPASRSAPQASGKGPTIPGTSGPMSPASSANVSPYGCSLKTWAVMSRLASTPSCVTYGEWVTRLRLACLQRQKRARRMNASGCSSWPTADGGHTGAERDSAAGNSDFSRTGGCGKPASTMWATPADADPRGLVGGTDRGRGARAKERAKWPERNGFGIGLGAQATTWSTPRGSDGEKGGPNQSFGAGGVPLASQTATWPTPAARDHKGENSPEHLTNGTGRLHMDQLPNAVAFLFSHPAPATRPHGPTLSQLRPIWRPLRASVIASHGRATWRRLWKGRTKRRLNPGFVEWLMGWPPGHALCACSETAFTRWQQDMRGALLALPMDCGPWIWKPPTQTAPTQMTLL
jgi:hypothetical protein